MSMAAIGVGAALAVCVAVVLVLIFRSREGREDAHGFGPVPDDDARHTARADPMPSPPDPARKP